MPPLRALQPLLGLYCKGLEQVLTVAKAALKSSLCAAAGRFGWAKSEFSVFAGVRTVLGSSFVLYDPVLLILHSACGFPGCISKAGQMPAVVLECGREKEAVCSLAKCSAFSSLAVLKSFY